MESLRHRGAGPLDRVGGVLGELGHVAGGAGRRGDRRAGAGPAPAPAEAMRAAVRTAEVIETLSRISSENSMMPKHAAMISRLRDERELHRGSALVVTTTRRTGSQARNDSTTDRRGQHTRPPASPRTTARPVVDEQCVTGSGSVGRHPVPVHISRSDEVGRLLRFLVGAVATTEGEGRRSAREIAGEVGRADEPGVVAELGHDDRRLRPVLARDERRP